MIYKPDPEGVAALQGMAKKLEQAVETIEQLSRRTRQAAESDQELLGPHAGSLAEALGAIQEAVQRAAEPAEGIRAKLNLIAANYEEIAYDDVFAEASGGAGSAGSAGDAGALSADEIQKNMDQTPTNEHGVWSDVRGESTWTPNDALARAALKRYGKTGVSYRSGLPDFSPFAAAEFQLKPSEYCLSDTRQEGILNDALGDYFDDMAISFGADPADPLRCPAFRDWMKKTFRCDASETENIFADVLAGETPYGFTWHHTEKPGVMQLVPSVIHSRATHRGGRSIWGGGAKCR